MKTILCLKQRSQILPLQETNRHLGLYPGLDEIFAFTPRFPEMNNVSFLWEGSRNMNLLSHSALSRGELSGKGLHASLHPLLPQVSEAQL